MNPRLLILLLVIALLGASIASLLAGAVALSPGELLQPGLGRIILIELRLPRLVLAILIGGILGLSGAVLQGLLRNPLAEPGLLGVSAGASLGAVIAIYYGLALIIPLATPIAGLVGGFIAAALAMWLSRSGGMLALILGGSAVTSIAVAGVTLALNLAPNPYAAYEIMTWLMGSLADRSWGHVALSAPFIVVGALLLLATGQALDALALGEAQAESLGVHVSQTRLIALFGTALGVGAATAVSGALAFVGLIAPHVVRPLVGYRPGQALIPAMLAGSILVVVADLATRLVKFDGPPVNLGVFISLIGSPFFLWLVLHIRKRAI